MTAARFLTLLWPGMPWLWLRGSLAGLVLALAFGVAVDVAVLTTWVWTDLVELPISIGLWTATATVWLVATASAVSAFPPPIRADRDAAADSLFVTARDAYLARDWMLAESRLRAVLDLSPTDGEAQLLLGTLLRRVGREAEAREALLKLARSDSGAVWRSVIDRELRRTASAENETVPAEDPPTAAEPAVILPLDTACEPAVDRYRTA